MILFTSDLDRTLIYSPNMIKTYPVKGQITPVELKNEQEIITYMSQETINLLHDFSKNNIFVPVTTRALYQYERIHVFAKEICPKYAITSNGGNILIDGRPDLEWNNFIHNRVSETAISKEEMLKLFAKIRHDSWVLREFYVDELFYMFHVEKENVPHNELNSLKNELLTAGWDIFLHGRKLYVLPTTLNKAYAVEHLKTLVDFQLHVAAGDSLMDYDMLASSHVGYSPIHGELYEEQPNNPKIKWLSSLGAQSAEELLQNLFKL